MRDKNDCAFSGAISEIKRISTKTGTAMASIKLQCWQESIRIVCFKDLAEEALGEFQTGSRVEVCGRLQSSKWEHEGVKYNGFQIVAEKVLPEGMMEIKPLTNMERPQPEYRPGLRDHEAPMAKDGDYF